MAEDDEQTDPQEIPRPRRRRHGRVGLGMVTTLTLAGLIFTVLFLSLSGRAVPIPEPVRAAIEQRINARMGGTPLSLGGIEFAVGRDGVPQILMNDIRFADLQGGAVAELNRLGAALAPGRLLRGELAASALYLAGAQITIRRTADGSFAFRSGQVAEAQAQSLPELFERIERITGAGALSSLREIHAGGVVITLEDARSGRIWQATNATAVLRKETDGLSLSVATDVFNGTDQIAGLQLSLSRSGATGRVSLGVKVTAMPAADIALQSPVLAWLGVLDAPISGSVRTQFDAAGQLLSFAGTLDIAQGALRPTQDVPPAEFTAAKAYFTFDPARQRIDFSQIEVDAAQGGILAAGTADLADFDGPWPRAFIGQFRVEDLHYEGGGVFQGPVSLNDLRADLRLGLAPFTVDLGQVAIPLPEGPLRLSGRVEAGEGVWRAAIDATGESLTPERLLEFWPVKVSPITRTWISKNLLAGTITEPAAALRARTGEKPDISLSFAFENGTARFLPEMPLLDRVRGRASLTDSRFTLAILEGGVTAATGDRIDASGSVFTVPDVRPKPAWGEIDIRARGPLPAALSVLDNRPVRLMQRAGRPHDIAQAEATARARVRLPLEDKVPNELISYEVSADLRDVSSDTLVPGRRFEAEALVLNATTDVVGIDGRARLDGVPLTASWRQPLGPEAKNGGVIEGRVDLGPAAVQAFGLPLPEGFVAGQGQGNYRLLLPLGAPSQLMLTSSLRGLTLSMPSLGWTKPAAEAGSLSVQATLGEVPEVQDLTLVTAGLDLKGRLDFAPGGFEAAEFQTVRIGDWLDASARLGGAGEAARVDITGGTFDLRKLDLDGARGGGGVSGSGMPITLALDRLVVSDTVALSPLTGAIRQSGTGLSGDFEARVNGDAPVRGTLAPANAGTALRLQANDASLVLRSAGLTPNARGGTLDLVLTPVRGAPSGTYDGQFLIEDIRLRDAPVMAGLLDAISVVGLLDQLQGAGIRFDTVDGQFRLTRERLTLQQAAAVGGSIGISADGTYDLGTKLMDFRGVISPVYFLNGIGSLLTRRGEGLFGFNYRVTGTTETPNVSVNPLSIFTPGAFRQIFRRPPPGEE